MTKRFRGALQLYGDVGIHILTTFDQAVQKRNISSLTEVKGSRNDRHLKCWKSVSKQF